MMRVLQVYLAVFFLLGIASAANISKPGCQDICGNVTIPYPFGIGEGCYLDAGFEITCSSSSYATPKAFIGSGNVEVKEILSEYVGAHYQYISYDCYNQTDWVNGSEFSFTLGSTFRFSDTRNKFTALGCSTQAYIIGNNSHDIGQYISGCLSTCHSSGSTTNGSCSGLGCCQTPIPKDLAFITVSLDYMNHSDVWTFSPCSYGFIVEQDSYNFISSDLLGFDFYNNNSNRGFPVVIDWAIRDGSCSDATNHQDNKCRSVNSYCYNATNGPGYLCNCSRGYEGNPYLEHGCQDIDECQDPEKYHCYGDCTNRAGGFECKCPSGSHGNATAEPCSAKFPLVAKLSVGISAGIVLLLALLSLLLIKLQKKKYLIEKEEYVRQNGGLILYEKMRASKVDTVRVFTEEELKKATNNFDDQRILGTGGRGEVYLGVLEDGREVAIKKSKGVDQNQEEEFANEIIILSQINHRSVVRLLGCCLEVPVPMLVYEFIPNGTLFDFLHRNISAIPLGIRLEIAVDSADALAYLHSSVAHSIIHGDVKSLNILLAANDKAKVADLGASSLLPLDKDQLVELVQGTIGYLDPECISTRQLTDKSDVYSFGVVLLELITRKPAIYTDEASSETKSLASTFVSTMNQNKLDDILDDQIVEEGTIDLLQEVAQLALRCVSVKREERPTMKEVAEWLQILTRSKYHPWTEKKSEETESLLGGREISAYATTSADTTAYNSVGNRLVLNIDGGR